MQTSNNTQMHTFLACESINLDSGSRAFKNAQSKLPVHVFEFDSMLQAECSSCMRQGYNYLYLYAEFNIYILNSAYLAAKEETSLH